MAQNPVHEIVERVLAASAGNLADAQMSGGGFRKLKKTCSELLKAYEYYKQLTADYDTLVKANAKTKREIKKYTRQGLDTTNLSAQLEEIRNQQKVMREQNDLLERGKAALKALYIQVFHLQTIVNGMLGQSISMAYVSTRGGTTQVVQLTKELTDDLYGIDIDRYGNLVLRYNISAIEKGIADLSAAQKERLLITSKVSTGMETLLANINERMDVARAHNSHNLMWKVNGEWRMTDLNNFGDLLESYVSMLINGDETAAALLDDVTGDVDMAIDLLVNSYLAKVDNASGFFQEDVQVGATNRYFGIKSAGASLMGFQMIVQFAQLIQDIVDKKQIDKKQVASLERKFKGNNKIRHAVTTVVETEHNLAIQAGIEELHQTMGRRS